LSKRANNQKRQQRYQKNLERELEQALSPGPSEGLYYVFDLDTKEKHKGLNRQQADELWQKLPRSFIMPHPQQ
jgi:hypothetical protein